MSLQIKKSYEEILRTFCSALVCIYFRLFQKIYSSINLKKRTRTSKKNPCNLEFSPYKWGPCYLGIHHIYISHSDPYKNLKIIVMLG